ncbi:MAG: TetR/AcrR family transcriptional regulator [Clostridia bacterium]|nr:TetR/AcrR family transcriptional regulator [Clostridia bacterium]
MENILMIHRSEGIVLTTIEVISECGIQAVSTREVARRQGVSEGAIFKHFRTKNDLMLGVLNHFSQYDQAIIKSIETKNLSHKEAIIHFFESYATYYHNYPAITALELAFDILQCDMELAEKVKNIFSFRFDFIQHLIIDAQRDGEICPNVNSDELACVLFGTFREICLKWRMSKYAFSLVEKAKSSFKMVMDAAVTETH